MTIEKLRYLLSTATAVFGDRKIGELTSQEIAAWRMELSPGYRSEAPAVTILLQIILSWRPWSAVYRRMDADLPVGLRKRYGCLMQRKPMCDVVESIGSAWRAAGR